MSDELRQAKQRVKSRFLGKHGVHAVGIRQADNAVSVYVDQDAPEPAMEVLDELRAAAAPCAVTVLREGRPAIRPD